MAVNPGAVATPELSVTAVATLLPLLAKVPLAPELGAVKVTVTLGTPLLPISLTVACNWAAKAVVTAALCGVPAVAAIEAGDPDA